MVIGFCEASLSYTDPEYLYASGDHILIFAVEMDRAAETVYFGGTAWAFDREGATNVVYPANENRGIVMKRNLVDTSKNLNQVYIHNNSNKTNIITSI